MYVYNVEVIISLSPSNPFLDIRSLSHFNLFLNIRSHFNFFLLFPKLTSYIITINNKQIKQEMKSVDKDLYMVRVN